MLCIKVSILPMQRGLYHTPVSVGGFAGDSTIPIHRLVEKGSGDTASCLDKHTTHRINPSNGAFFSMREDPREITHKELNIR
jgi:hypothetical protein